MMTEMLQKHGCKTDFVSLEKGNTRINVKIHAKEETQINGQGPEASKDEMEQLLQKISLLKKEDVLVLAGSVPGSCPTDIYELFFEALQEKNVKVVVDTTGEALLKVLPYHPFLIKPNVEELGELFGMDLSCEKKEELINYGRKLQQMGAKNVLISRDKKGAVLITEEGNCFEKLPPQGEVVNSVGAGDSMVAGFLTGYLNTKDYEKALELAVVTGSATAFRAWLAEKEDVEKLLIRQPREYGL